MKSKRKDEQLRHFNVRQLSKAQQTYWDLLSELCREYDHLPEFSKAGGLLRARDFVGLVDHADWIDGQMYPSAAQHFAANQLAALVRKYPTHPLPVKPEAVAAKKFFASEHRCKRINQRFRCYEYRSPHEDLLSRSRNFISYVLGLAPNFERIWAQCGFGPGASIGVSGNATNVARKIESSWSVTPGAYTYGLVATRYHPYLREYLLSKVDGGIYCDDPSEYEKKYLEKTTVVQHNNICFVPKTAKSSRTIAVEPLVNGFLQKGIDLEMRKKLLRIGIDLRDQSKNVEFARLGSLDDSPEGFVTIDLSSASDSIATGVVRNLLPPDWFAFLDACRSKSFKLNGETFSYHKFCSMGNGFCFPLETLIFSSACVAVGCGNPGTDFLVYGDDIIVKAKHAAVLLDFLKVLGFRVNERKTFLQGPFRESCGGNWFGGIDVSPYTLDGELDSLQALFKAHNLTLRNERTAHFFSNWRDTLRQLVPPKLRFVQPHGQADAAFVVDQDILLTSPHVLWSNLEQRWITTVLAPIPAKDMAAIRCARVAVRMYAVLQGSRSDALFTTRHESRTKVVTAKSRLPR